MLLLKIEVLTKTLLNQHNINFGVFQPWAGSSAWLERSTDNRKVAGSNPARPTKLTTHIDFKFTKDISILDARYSDDKDGESDLQKPDADSCCCINRRLNQRARKWFHLCQTPTTSSGRSSGRTRHTGSNWCHRRNWRTRTTRRTRHTGYPR